MSLHPAIIRQVLEGDYCIGCGTCASRPDAKCGINIRFDEFGFYKADIESASSEDLKWADSVCPFANNNVENKIAEELFDCEGDGIQFNGVIGFYRELLAGHSIEFRDAGSSGGVATWLLSDLIDRGEVDAVIHVARSGCQDPFFDYTISYTRPAILKGSTSMYYPVKLDDILEQIRNRPGRYVVTAIPCFSKALRLVAQNDPVIAERIRYVVGIVCGHMKSKLYLDFLARKAGVTGGLEDACFRRKDVTKRADNYLFEATYRNSSGEVKKVTVAAKDIGANWGMGFFKPKACDYCDDLFAETADIALMDGWLPKYVEDGRGTSLVVVRSADLLKRMRSATEEGLLQLEKITEQDVINSQRGGLNHRRVGLRYRLHLARAKWVPLKRVKPSNTMHWAFRADQIVRLWLRRASVISMREQQPFPGLERFNSAMKLPILIFKLLSRIKAKFAAHAKGYLDDHHFNLDPADKDRK